VKPNFGEVQQGPLDSTAIITSQKQKMLLLIWGFPSPCSTILIHYHIHTCAGINGPSLRHPGVNQPIESSAIEQVKRYIYDGEAGAEMRAR